MLHAWVAVIGAFLTDVTCLVGSDRSVPNRYVTCLGGRDRSVPNRYVTCLGGRGAFLTGLTAEAVLPVA